MPVETTATVAPAVTKKEDDDDDNDYEDEEDFEIVLDSSKASEINK